MYSHNLLNQIYCNQSMKEDLNMNDTLTGPADGLLIKWKIEAFQILIVPTNDNSNNGNNVLSHGVENCR